MRIFGSLLIAMALLAACERSGSSPQSNPAAPATTAAPVAALTPALVSASPSVPLASPSATPSADDDDDDFDKPSGPDFEIDADADWYFGFAPMVVHFSARPLNGKPPFTYVWNFGDGTPTTTGETTIHNYEKVGRYSPFVVCTDGNGEESRVDFVIVVVTPEQWAERREVDVSRLRPWPSPSPTPIR